MKLLLVVLLLQSTFVAGCITPAPALRFAGKPPRACVSVPPIPVELCIGLTTAGVYREGGEVDALD